MFCLCAGLHFGGPLWAAVMRKESLITDETGKTHLNLMVSRWRLIICLAYLRLDGSATYESTVKKNWQIVSPKAPSYYSETMTKSPLWLVRQDIMKRFSLHLDAILEKKILDCWPHFKEFGRSKCKWMLFLSILVQSSVWEETKRKSIWKRVTVSEWRFARINTRVFQREWMWQEKKSLCSNG